MENTIRIRENHSEIEKHPIVCSLDVHSTNIYMYILNRNTGEILCDCNILGGFKAVLKHIIKLKIRENMIIIYEASNYGFYPYRLFTKRGYACKIIAPNSIPQKKNLKKTDWYDATENANYHIAGLLRYVHIRTEKDEQSREVLRYRCQQIWKIIKQKQYIQAFTKRYGLEYNLTAGYWTKKHYQWLNTVELPSMPRELLDLKLSFLSELENQLAKLEKILDDIFEKDETFKRLFKLYSLIRGVGRINAMTLVLEGQDIKRFAKSSALMSYTGLVPGKHSTGTSDPHLRITKSGNKFLRTALVGIAKMYRDKRTLRTKKELNGIPEPLKSFLERCQTRLNGRYRHLVSKGKHSNKARCAIARELCGFIWELVVKIEPTLKEEQYKLVA